jgi:hypothetical protein
MSTVDSAIRWPGTPEHQVSGCNVEGVASVEDPDLPAAVEPMLAAPDNGHLPDDRRFCYEFK